MRNLLLVFTLGIAAAFLHESDEKCTPNKEECQPQQIHIAFGEKINDITVTWSTFDNTEDSIVEYGEGNLDKKVKGEHKLFVDGGSLKNSQWIHNVKLKDLKFNTSCVYKVGSQFGWSKQFSFKVPPAGEDGPINIIILGDMGHNNDYSREPIENDLQANHYYFIIHVGDFAYDFYGDNGTIGDKFMNRIQEIAANYPYMTCPGNHEHMYNYSHYKNRFTMPANFESMFYSFDIGPIHFIALNTEAYFNNKIYPAIVPIKQKRPWIITYGHRPFYCSNLGDGCGSDYYHRVGISSLGGYAIYLIVSLWSQ